MRLSDLCLLLLSFFVVTMDIYNQITRNIVYDPVLSVIKYKLSKRSGQKHQPPTSHTIKHNDNLLNYTTK